MKETDILRGWIEECSGIVAFTGAGCSTESGIPDFRSVDGLYSQQWSEPPETILSHDYFMRHTESFYDFYRKKMLYPDAKPNRAHLALSRLESLGRLRAVVTQNIDGLHQAAGSKNVLELHGSVLRNFCMSCGEPFPLEDIISGSGIPRCKKCGGVIKPDVVLYQEGLDPEVMLRAERAIAAADMLIVGGTSLGVYPAAGLLEYFGGGRLVLINKTPTPRDAAADLIIRGSIGDALSAALPQ